MSVQASPSKQVSISTYPTLHLHKQPRDATCNHYFLNSTTASTHISATMTVVTDTSTTQVTSGIQNLNMDSTAKKLDFGATDKENKPFDADLAKLEAEIDAEHHANKKASEAKKIAPTLKPEEAAEPLLTENPQRFVLFPIKYHEVCHASQASP